MLHNRERLGTVDLNWQDFAFGIGKPRRKTIGFGRFDKKNKEWEDEVYIKELSILDGGIGCAVWDAAIYFSRWMIHHSSLFQNKSVLELGSGVGLPGIIAARWASIVYLSDYLEPILNLIRYNIDVNSNFDPQEELSDDELIRSRVAMKKHVKQAARVVYLNWDEIETSKNDTGIEPVDIIIGSELTYSGNVSHIGNLVTVIDTFLKKDGLFIEILSDDRDGVPVFLTMMRDMNWDCQVERLDPMFLTETNTKQRKESYNLYFFRRTQSNIRQDNCPI